MNFELRGGGIGDFLGGEEGLIEVIGYVDDLAARFERAHFGRDVAPFEGYQSVGKRIALFAVDIFSANFQQVALGHDGAAHHKIEFVAAFGHIAMVERDVFYSAFFGYLAGHEKFLACAVDEVEMDFGKHHRQRDSGEAASCAEIEHA